MMPDTALQSAVGWRMSEVAARLAAELQDGWFVNLGIGLPTMVADSIPEGREVIFHSENGILGLGPKAAPGMEDPNLMNAGKEAVTLLPGGSFFSQSESFAMIRGGHINAAVLGAFQVSAAGDLASWKLPGEPLGRVGGAMDLAVGAERVFVLMEHTSKNGQPKLVSQCSFPLTGQGCVTRVFTNLGVFRPSTNGFVVEELAPGVDHALLADVTDAPLF
jgi:3-oxoadipate CoA-transferase, beta subunit